MNDLHDVMYKRLQQCHLSVYGYDNINEKYWGKKVNQTCYLSFTVVVVKKTNNLSLMTIDVFIDDASEIKNIIKTLSSNTECNQNAVSIPIQRIKQQQSNSV